MPHNAAIIEDKLIKKFGFERSNHKGDDHYRYEIKIPGVPIIQTHFSHGDKQSDKLENKIARQLRVRRPFLNGMIECTNSRDAYFDQVKRDPSPPFEDFLLNRMK